MLLHFDGPNVERWQWDNLPDHVAPDWQSREYIQSLWNELHKYNNGFDKKASVFAPRNDNRQDHIGKVMYHLPLSPSSRRMYMESKEMNHDTSMRMKELEQYMQDLSKDITEMIGNATPEEKVLLQKKLATLSTKVV